MHLEDAADDQWRYRAHKGSRARANAETARSISPASSRSSIGFNSTRGAAPPAVGSRTRIVSAARIRLDHRKSVRPFKGIFCHDISEIADRDHCQWEFLIDLSCFE